ncbi:hypothetical protein F4803DRAFT_533214 [Xylaria telfairii]|nr:hypothetical protein F4803DRAFT_533214 [Xylaria telfairii]
MSGQMASSFQSFETSGLIIKRDGWKILGPHLKRIKDERSAQEFITTIPLRDKRMNFEDSRFRFLYMENKDRKSTHKEAIMKTARDAGWIKDEFITLVTDGPMGSAMLEGSETISIILQTPKDDMPFLSMSLTELGEKGRTAGLDWVCVLFASPSVDLQPLLGNNSFPRDFGDLSIDFMFLPVQLLESQTQFIREEVTKLKDSVAAEEQRTRQANNDQRIQRGDHAKLFAFEQKHSQLHTRSIFIRDLADSIKKCFDEIVKRHNMTHRPAVQYSTTLKKKVEAQVMKFQMMQPDLDAIQADIQAQHRKIDASLNTLIAQNSLVVSEQALRDSSSMKAIAVVTLIFLPSTFIAAIFSMSMFNWLAGDQETVISNRLWIFVLFSVSLTLIVLFVWKEWDKRNENKLRLRRSQTQA